MVRRVSPQGFGVEESRCIRCAACSTLVPTVFALRETAATVVRQPADDDEHMRTRAALLICPARAIRASTEIA